ncbi:MAG: bifunctional diaminohydroxyphosphoribosylaminopyrimidine deaminase/5-amino-6-(5-phosphoribosylamino)uracil reductase RibD [Microcoleaceae cyanobacterium]
MNLLPPLSEASEPTSHQRMMRRCIELARHALGQTAPNPLVGCVIVQSQTIVGEGFHPAAGQPHAEVFALRDAGEKAAGATVYVNLEPCNHQGRTPPCTSALIAAKVAKVVVGMVDPNPLVSGLGIERLIQAGIEVVVGVEEAACQQLNEAFVHRIRCRQPFGILKYAMTLDGKIAATSGHSAWVTSPAARQTVHRLRVACDAVIVGGNTVRRDNPRLTTHQQGEPNPLRVVMSRTLDLPPEAHLWDTQTAKTLVMTTVGANPELQQILRKQGVEVVEFPTLTCSSAMNYLYEQQLLSVLWECGGQLAAQAIAEGCVQKILAFIAPKIIGGQSAPSPVGDLGLDKMTDALTLKNITLHSIGSDYLIEGYLNE